MLATTYGRECTCAVPHVVLWECGTGDCPSATLGSLRRTRKLSPKVQLVAAVVRRSPTSTAQHGYLALSLQRRCFGQYVSYRGHEKIWYHCISNATRSCRDR